MLDAETEPSAEAQAMWATALEALAEELPRTTFDTWLKDTEGVRCEGDNLVVRVASVFTIAWLEQRMYQTILRAVRDSSRPRVGREVRGWCCWSLSPAWHCWGCRLTFQPPSMTSVTLQRPHLARR